MFWYIVGFFAVLVALGSLYACAGAFGMQDDDTPPSDYEKMLGLGTKLKDKAAAKQARSSARANPND